MPEALREAEEEARLARSEAWQMRKRMSQGMGLRTTVRTSADLARAAKQRALQTVDELLEEDSDGDQEEPSELHLEHAAFGLEVGRLLEQKPLNLNPAVNRLASWLLADDEDMRCIAVLALGRTGLEPDFGHTLKVHLVKRL